MTTQYFNLNILNTLNTSPDSISFIYVLFGYKTIWHLIVVFITCKTHKKPDDKILNNLHMYVINIQDLPDLEEVYFCHRGP